MPADPEVMPLWSDPQACADYTLTRVDEDFPAKARGAEGGWVIAGKNYGQGPSRENAALELSVLGIDAVLAKSFARIHYANLVNFGILPLTFADESAYDRLEQGDELKTISDVASRLLDGANRLTVNVNDEWVLDANVELTEPQRETLVAGGKLTQLSQE